MRIDSIENGNVQIIVQKLFRKYAGISKVDRNRKHGESLSVARDQRCHIKWAIGADPQLTLPQSPKVLEMGYGLLEAREHAPHNRKERRARGREPHPASMPVKKLDLVKLFDQSDLAGDGGLADVEASCGCGEAAFGRHRKERPGLCGGHRFFYMKVHFFQFELYQNL